jgi:hypothetical protein
MLSLLGNAEKDGFGHLAVAVEDVYKFCEELEKTRPDVGFKKKPNEGRMKVKKRKLTGTMSCNSKSTSIFLMTSDLFNYVPQLNPSGPCISL